MTRLHILVLLVVFLWNSPQFECATVSTLECGACSLLVRHFELKIAAVDPKKTISGGSFRVSPDGQQKGLKEVSFARSDSHLTEIIESVCDEAKHYKLVVNTLTGKSVYVPKDSTFLSGDESGKMRSKLESACNDFVDSNEDILLAFLKAAHEEPIKEFCHKELGVCSAVDVAALPPSEPPKPEEDVMDLSDIPEDEL